MSERKNIDKLFQEKFKDFEAEPSAEMWPRIEARLKEKEDRKIIPFWWKLSGVAAALLLGFFITDGYLNRGGIAPKDSIVIEEHPNGNTINDKAKPIGNPVSNENAVTPTRNQHRENNNSIDNNAVVATENTGSETSKTGSGIVKSKSNPGNKLKQTNAAVVSNEKSNIDKANGKTSASPLRKRETNPAIVSNESPNAENANQKTAADPTKKLHSKKSKNIQNANNQLAATTAGKASEGKSIHLKASESTAKDDPLQNKNTNTNGQNPGYNPDLDNPNSGIANQNPAGSKLKSAQNPNTTATEKDQKSNPIAGSEIKKEVKKIDSTAIATVVPNALEELLKEKENNLVTKGPHINRWQITSSVAPIYFGSTSGGSPIDTTFSGNSKDYKTKVSVGLGVNYAINKKLSIRTGINTVAFDYNTNNVEMSTGFQSNTLGGVTLTGNNQYLHFGRRAVTTGLVAAGSDLSTTKFDSSINQKMSYIEVPLELSYALVNKRFGVDIIAGMSTLFLNQNEVTILSDGLKTDLGEANNLNKTHFSSNIGLGIKYRIFKAIQANFEPKFKYQINTFSKNDGDFKPYFFGLYTGLSYTF